VTIWTIDGNLGNDMFFDLEYIGIFGTFDSDLKEFKEKFDVTDLKQLHT
jgi:hypothetical protein